MSKFKSFINIKQSKKVKLECLLSLKLPAFADYRRQQTGLFKDDVVIQTFFNCKARFSN